MTSIVHRGHVELDELELGATLTFELGRIKLDIASTNQAQRIPLRLEIIRFRSNTGYFTLTNLSMVNQNLRLGVGGLSSYSVGLALESAHFQTEDEIRSTTWSMIVSDFAKILHVNGVIKEIIRPETGGTIMTYTVSSPPTVDLTCASVQLTLRLGQHIRWSGDSINGPTINLTYPIELVFPEDVSIEVALRFMHRIQQILSLVMGRVLPINSASMKIPSESHAHEVPIHGILVTDKAEKPTKPVLPRITPEILAAVIDCWLSRYDELGDAIHLYMSGLEQRRLPTELKFQIFVQSLEALHRRIAPTAAQVIDSVPIVEILREREIPSDVVDRVKGVLAHAHEPGLRQRLRHYWDRFEAEITTLRPAEKRKAFIGRVAATRNHYAHRTDPDEQVLAGTDLWDATETVKAISHMALLNEVGADITGIGQKMLDSRFAEYVLLE